MTIQSKFSRLGTDDAPGQEARRATSNVDWKKGDSLPGRAVDFSHGDVDAHPPAPGALEAFTQGVERGGAQAYTEYRGAAAIRDLLAGRLAELTGAPVDARDGLILTPGTQGALFLALAATVAAGDKVAIVQPDYFANRKLVAFLDGEALPVRLDRAAPSDAASDTGSEVGPEAASGGAGLDLGALAAAFRAGAKVFLFSNPNNPTGVVYSAGEIARIAALAAEHGATVIVDALYARLLYDGVAYRHLRAVAGAADAVVTIMGPSKTESLSGYRLGVAFGPAAIIERMEKLQAIVSLRAAGYSQAVLRTWLAEPAGWLERRIRAHQRIRDDLVAAFRAIDGCTLRTPGAGSYLFPEIPALAIAPADFVTALREQAAVIVTPGTEFSPHAARSIRLNFSQDPVAAVAAVGRLAALVERYRA